jgi:hypothetical protein
MRRHSTQLLYHGGQDLERGINIVSRIESAQAEADAGASLLRLEPDGGKHVRGFE